LRDAVDLATRAIIAAGESDDALADAAEALDGRAFATLREFFIVLKKGGASVRVVTDDLDRSFDVSAVLVAADRRSIFRQEERWIESWNLGTLASSVERDLLKRSVKR